MPQPSTHRSLAWLKDLIWPCLAGVVIAVLYLQQQQIHSLQQRIASMPAAPAIAQATTASYAEAVARAMPAVVNIYTSKAAPADVNNPLYRLFGRNMVPKRQRSTGSLGSGVIVSERGYVLTNQHVVADATEILVTLNDGRESRATLIGQDSETDLAVLKIELDNLPVISFGDPQRARIGDVVLAIGNPFGVGQTVTQGVISAAARYGLEMNLSENYLQTDAAINQGNSGGALVDAQGLLLGINSALQSPTGSSVGIGYALPADTAEKVLNDIIEHGHVVRGWLGIEANGLADFSAQRLGLSRGQGLLITAVYRNGPAAQAGLQPGDVITHFDNVPVEATRAGIKRITHGQPGEKLQLHYIREQRPQVATVTIGERPDTQAP